MGWFVRNYSFFKRYWPSSSLSWALSEVKWISSREILRILRLILPPNLTIRIWNATSALSLHAHKVPLNVNVQTAQVGWWIKYKLVSFLLLAGDPINITSQPELNANRPLKKKAAVKHTAASSDEEKNKKKEGCWHVYRTQWWHGWGDYVLETSPASKEMRLSHGKILAVIEARLIQVMNKERSRLCAHMKKGKEKRAGHKWVLFCGEEQSVLLSVLFSQQSPPRADNTWLAAYDAVSVECVFQFGCMSTEQ